MSENKTGLEEIFGRKESAKPKQKIKQKSK